MKGAHNPILAAARFLTFLLWLLVVIGPYSLVLATGRLEFCRRFARFFWKTVAWIIGFQIIVRGEPSSRRPTLFVANHSSYLDIVVLGSLLQAVFVAKGEVRRWPGFGLIARLGRTLFVERRARKSLEQRDQMRALLDTQRESMILFPEGTSNDGIHVLPFKSTLFSAAEWTDEDGVGLPVQPISIAYTRLDGMPLSRAWKPFFAWYGGMDLAPHLWFMLGLGRTTVEVIFHDCVRLADFSSRRALSEHCRRMVVHGVAAANTGRLATALDTTGSERGSGGVA